MNVNNYGVADNSSTQSLPLPHIPVSTAAEYEASLLIQ